MTDLQTPEEVREEIVPGVARALSPMARRILAMNPSPATGLGTNTYMIGIDEIAIVDPGPLDRGHLDSIVGCGGDLIRWILVTNDDPAYAGAVEALKERTGAKVLAFGDTPCDEKLKDGSRIVATEFRLTCRHLPGPSPKNVGFVLEEERMLLSGKLIVDGPPQLVDQNNGGNMAQYMQSLQSLRKLRLRRIAPGHGYVFEEPKKELPAMIADLEAREEQILDLVANGPLRIEELTTRLFGDDSLEVIELQQALVLSHLQKLRADGKVRGTKNFIAA